MEKQGSYNEENIRGNGPRGFFIYHAYGGEELTHVNQGMAELFGCETIEEFKELTGNSFKGIVHPDDLDRVEDSIVRQIARDEGNQDYVEYRIIRKDGEVRYVEDFGHLGYDEREGEVFYVFVRDITENVLMMDGTVAWNDTEERRTLIDVLSNTVHEYREIYYINLVDNYYRMVFPDYYSKKESGNYSAAIRRHFEDGRIRGEDPKEVAQFLSAAHIREGLRDKDTLEMKYRRMSPEGGEEWCLVSISVRDRKDGEPVTAILTIREIEELVRSEARLKEALTQAQFANKSKTTFLSNMSHDIRTPMNAIMGFSTLAENNIDNKAKVLECLKKIHSSCNHLLSLINDVLDMSHIESGKMQLQERPCNISERLHSMVHMVLPQVRAKKLNFSVEAEDVRNEDVYTDPLKIEQAFLNILSNAVKYTKPGGSVSVVFRQKESGVEGFGAYEFVVSDTGVGMSEEFLKHIFLPFERENTSTISGVQGTGVGMTITKSIIDMLGGTIEVESKLGVGSTFTVKLPLKIQDVGHEDEALKELSGLHVLVVDDDFSICSNVTKMLTEVGMRPEWTMTGREAVFRAEMASEGGDPFQTYIVDWEMPEMNGVDTVRNIRRTVGGEVPIIILTSYDWSNVEEEAREAGVTEFCNKPLFLSDLRSVMLKANHIGTEGEEEEEQYAFGGRRVLVVEDNELNREIAEELLKEAGFAVESAADGAVAVNMVANSEENHYDVILMDIQMPVLNGYDATKQIRALPRHDVATMPIIAMSANAFLEDKERCIESGMNEHLAKPLNIEEMFAMLKEYLKA